MRASRSHNQRLAISEFLHQKESDLYHPPSQTKTNTLTSPQHITTHHPNSIAPHNISQHLPCAWDTHENVRVRMGWWGLWGWCLLRLYRWYPERSVRRVAYLCILPSGRLRDTWNFCLPDVVLQNYSERVSEWMRMACKCAGEERM